MPYYLCVHTRLIKLILINQSIYRMLCAVWCHVNWVRFEHPHVDELIEGSRIQLASCFCAISKCVRKVLGGCQ